MTPNPCVSASEARTRDVIFDRVCDRIDAGEVTYASIYQHYKTIRAKSFERLKRREFWHFSCKTAMLIAEAAGVGITPTVDARGDIRLAIR